MRPFDTLNWHESGRQRAGSQPSGCDTLMICGFAPYTTRRDCTLTIQIHGTGRYVLTPSRADPPCAFELLGLLSRPAA